MITKDQIRDGRRLLGLSAEDFAKRVNISRRSLQRIEMSTEALEKAAFGTVLKIKAELEDSGIELLPDGTVKRRPS